jgi:hypothetical protein
VTAGARVRSWIAAAIAVGAFALLVPGVILGPLLPGADWESGTAVMIVLVVTASLGIGALLAVRRPENPIGWLLLASGAFWALLMVGDTYAQYGWPQSPRPLGTMLARWGATWSWLAGRAVLRAALPPPPARRPPAPRWRPVVWVGGVALGATVLAQWFVPWGPDGYHFTYAIDAVNPIGIPRLHGVSVELWALVILVPLTLAAIASLAVRFRRAGAVVRQQMKWVLFGVAAAIVVHLTVIFGSGLLDLGVTRVEDYTFGLVLGAFPVTIGLAVLRYRLYDIDRIVSRAVAYAGVTLTLVGLYAAGVVGLGALARSVTGDASNDLVVAASTLAVAAAFGPVRRRVQAVVDRRFNRTRYDAARTVESFGARLREEVDLDLLATDLRGVVVETMRPAHVALWLPAGDHPG